MGDDYLDEEMTGGPKGSAGLMFVTISAVLMAAAVAVLPWIAGGPGAKVDLNNWTIFFGDLHPIILHLPVGIFVLILCMELAGFLSFGKWRPQTAFPLFIGVVSAVVSVFCGYFLFLQGDRPADEVSNHLWSSIAFTVIATLAFLARLWANHSGVKSPIYGILLLLAVGMMGYAAHEGGEMTHGDPFGPLIKSLKGGGGPANGPMVAVTKPVGERLAYEEVVVPILYNKCYECHAEADMNPKGKKKIKGKLVMTSMEALAKGGSSGDPAVTPGDLENSTIHYAIHLPIDEDEHMPPEDKEQLEKHEIAILEWWILAGAPVGKAMSALDAPAEILEAVEKLVPPAELQARAKAKAEAEAKKKKLEEAVALVSGEFPNALNFVSQESGDLTFTAVSMRKEFDDEDLAKLGPVAAGLAELEIGATSVSDAGAEHLRDMLALRRLKLNETGITDAALDVVAGLQNLEYLNLVGTAVTDEGIKKLEDLPKLKKLYLWRSKVTKEGAAALNASLPECEINLGWE
jgi:uncharacterized membrane protein